MMSGGDLLVDDDAATRHSPVASLDSPQENPRRVAPCDTDSGRIILPIKQRQGQSI